MYDFIYNLGFIYKKCYMMMEMGEKTLKYKKMKTRKKSPVCLPSHLPVYEMEANCFSEPEDTKNKLDQP